MGMILERGGVETAIDERELRVLVARALDAIDTPKRRVLIVPPDFTRFNSRAGVITAMIYDYLSPRGAEIDIIPALGTHVPMTEHEIRVMFGDNIPLDRFKEHDWRNDVVSKGVVPGGLLKEWSEGKVDFEVDVEVNKILFDGYDLILSVGQIVPHEVVGMANYTKNIMVGVGGADTINKSHFLGAAYNMERIMGRADSPVRRLFNYGVDEFLGDLPIYYMLTVMARGESEMEMRGFFVSGDDSAFLAGCGLSQRTNLELLDGPLKKVVVYLDPEEFKSTWLGNKAVYRTRMAIADDGELIVLAPGLREFGEDKEIDRLIRKYGYRGTESTLASVASNAELRDNLSAAAHLIHGSSEGRFKITYCPGSKVSAAEIAAVGFEPGDLTAMTARYRRDGVRDGFNRTVDGEEFFYISNPALGLWALKANFI